MASTLVAMALNSYSFVGEHGTSINPSWPFLQHGPLTPPTGVGKLVLST